LTAPRRKTALSLVEAFALAVLVALATLVVSHTLQQRRMQLVDYYSAAPIAELEALKQYNLSRRSSLNFEEFIIRDYFKDRRNGVFLDVGANHYRRGNNSYFLETNLGWSGIAVDALEEFAADYQTYRPKTRYVAMFASDVADARVKFFVPKNNMESSSNQEFTVRGGVPGVSRTVPTTTLTAVLDEAGIQKLDLLSMDIELSEPAALAGFEIDRFKPGLVCIEGHREVRQQILDYFARHDYVLIGKYLRIDPYNLYFQPLTAEHAQ
jgi:FkbM family methyltransferase